MLNRRQFIIMDCLYEEEDFRSLQLPCGLVLSYHKDLMVSQKGDNVLLGLAFSSEEDTINLEHNPINSMQSWTGRWVLITPSALYTDACGTLGIFYSDINHKVISSSLRIMQKIMPTQWIANYQIKYGDGLPYMDYYPIPFTPYSGIKKLLPTQYISFKFGIMVYDESWYEKYKEYNITQLYSALKSKMLTCFQNIKAKYDGNIWIPLTSGVDSRTNLAFAIKSGMKFGAYTSIRDNTDEWDLKAPKIICKILGIPHFYMDDRNATNSYRQSEYEAHCGGIVTVGTDKNQYIKENDVPNADEAIVLWGTAWEVYGRNFWGVLEAGNSADERFTAWNQYSSGVITQSNIHEQSLRYWLKYLDTHPMHSMDWRQRMYYEQRVGSWLSSAYQAIDLFDSSRICPVNCYDIFGILINLVDKTFPEGSRSTKQYQVQVINEFLPQIRSVPYEIKISLGQRLLHKMKCAFSKIIVRRKN